MQKVMVGNISVPVKLDLTEPEVRNSVEKRLNEIAQMATKAEIPDKYNWSSQTRKYAETLYKVQSVMQSKELSGKITEKLVSDLKNMIDRCAGSDFHIAFVGAIKAGKSTLINAMLDCELASTQVTPETAALTKFKKATDKNYVKLIFYTTAEWQKLTNSAKESRAEVFWEEYKSLNAESVKTQFLDKGEEKFECDTVEKLKETIKQWTSSKSPHHYFVKEVEVGFKDCDLPKNVVFVDTPGLDDAVEYRSNITRDYINRANAVLVCVKSDALTGPEVQTICGVFANTRYKPEKVYVMATQLDNLNNPEEDWKLQSLEWLKHLAKGSCFGNRQLAEKNLVPVSAYLHTLIKDQDILEKDRRLTLRSILLKLGIEELKDISENREKLYAFTNIGRFNHTLDENIIKKAEEYTLSDIAEQYRICKKELTQSISKIQDNALEILETSKKDIEEIRVQQQKAENNLKELSKVKAEMEARLKEFKHQTQAQVDELRNKLAQASR